MPSRDAKREAPKEAEKVLKDGWVHRRHGSVTRVAECLAEMPQFKHLKVETLAKCISKTVRKWFIENPPPSTE